MDTQQTAELPQSKYSFGTFMGVFTPSLLTILGVIMYLRFGWMVGNVGIPLALLIVTISTSITFVTALSVSAVATNMKVGVGGEYFLISRSLGLELGGAIGIPLYLARAASVTLYAFGLAEVLRFFIPELPIQPVAAGIILLVTLVSAKSASLTLKIQIPLMIAVFLSIVVMAIGVFGNPSPAIVKPTYINAPGFWVVLAIFFPAVTGFTAGVGLSGDLKDPSRSIPRGTLAAVVCGYLIYMGISVLLAFAAPAKNLVSDNLIWNKIAGGAAFILPGMIGAILSSAIGSILAGPRVLQALAADRVLPGFLGKISPKSGEPMLAIWLTGGISMLLVLVGDLNAIAPVVTMFFLTFYTSINLVSGLERLIGDPSYRPRINVPWYISFLGAAGSIAVMFLINKVACVIALSVELVVWLLLRRRALEATFGDLRRGFFSSLIKTSLENLRTLPMDPRNWRPHILLFSGNVKKRRPLIRLADSLNQKRGILTVCDLQIGDLDSLQENMHERAAAIDDYLHDQGLTTFAECPVVENLERGFETTAQANGIAGLESNTIMFGWSKRPSRMAMFLRVMRRIGKLGKSVVIARFPARSRNIKPGRIDIWWRGGESNGDMMLLLAHLLSLNTEWRGSTITLKSVAADEEDRAHIEEGLTRMLHTVRIKAETRIILQKKGQKPQDLIRRESRGAAIVFMGMAEPEQGKEQLYARRLKDLIEGLPAVILVKNSSYFAGKLV